jgi:hypothetical protein
VPSRCYRERDLVRTARDGGPIQSHTSRPLSIPKTWPGINRPISHRNTKREEIDRGAQGFGFGAF